MLTVVDHGVGNIGSLASALRFLGATFEVSSDPAALRASSAVILPGVGAFQAAAERLDALGLREPLRARAADGLPILGVCLGMQLLFAGSEEGPGEGLGLLAGRCERLGATPGVKVPHVGFDTVSYPESTWLHDELGAEADYYFTHSYAVRATDAAAVGRCGYDGGLVAVVEDWPVLGAQFHPEKSQTSGLRLLLAFIRRATGAA
jgi:imidazole glycerol-phosphate synthase subunit HisH